MKDAIIHLEGLRFGYKSDRVLFSGLDLEIPTRAFVGLLGPNGSGKTTLIRLIAGLLRPQSGSILVDGRPVHRYRPSELAKKIAVVSQGPSALPGFTVAETVLMARIALVGMRVFLDSADLQVVRSSLRMTGTEGIASRRLDQLSGGELQRVFLARALAQQSDVIILDEPTAYLDIQHQIQTYELLKAAQLEQGRTVIVVSHDLHLADRYCDLVVLLGRGEDGVRLFTGTPQQVLTAERIGQVFGVPVACGIVAGHRVFAPITPKAGQPKGR